MVIVFSGPYISIILPLGTPPIPKAISRLNAPVGIASTFIALNSPSFITEPLPNEMGDSHIGLQARLMSQALRKLAGAVNKSKTVIIFINQLREKVGVMFGNPETTTGGRAIFPSTSSIILGFSNKYFLTFSLPCPILSLKILNKMEKLFGNRAKVKIVKNKVAPPFGEAEISHFSIYFCFWN